MGRDFELWKGVLCRHGIGNCNDNGRLLLEFCSEHQLVITSTLFQQKDRFKAKWRHPRSKHWHLLDYVLTRQHDTRDVLHTRVMPSAEGAFALKSHPKRKGPQTKKLQVHKLRDPRVKNNLQVMLEERPHCVTAAEPEEQWKQMKTISRKPQLKCLACLSGNTKTGLTKQIRNPRTARKETLLQQLFACKT